MRLLLQQNEIAKAELEWQEYAREARRIKKAPSKKELSVEERTQAHIDSRELKTLAFKVREIGSNVDKHDVAINAIQVRMKRETKERFEQNE